jgi:small Trp-rich protein
MAFVILGVLLVVAKLAGWGALADRSWLWIISPFFLALLWWWWSDASGLTRRREMERDQERKDDRRRRQIEALGMTQRLGKRNNGKR